MGIIPILCLLLLVVSVNAQETCQNACENKYTQKMETNECNEGCRLAVIFGFVSKTGDINETREKCRDGCKKSYNQMELQNQSNDVSQPAPEGPCNFGCDHQPLSNKAPMEISISSNDATFDVASKAMMGPLSAVFPRFGRRQFSDFNSLDGTSSDEWSDPFATMRQMMQRHMEMAHKIHHHMALNSFGSDNEVTARRPSGHLAAALQGPQVGNRDSNGLSIIDAEPVESAEPPKHTYAHIEILRPGEHPRGVRYPYAPSSLVERMSQRAHRLSNYGQWLICVALLLCLLSMLGIMFAIIRQIKLQRGLRYRQTHLVIPATFGQTLPAKKVPLESPAAAMDYPLIHDTPPPAYDQLSIHKEKADDSQQA